MTTVLIDFKNKKIVADKQLTCNMVEEDKVINEQVWYEETSKIKQIKEGVYFVGSGNNGALLRQWSNLYTTGMIDPNPQANCNFAVVRTKDDGLFVDIYEYKETITWYGKKYGKFTRSVRQGNDNVMAFGSGGDYAYGAFMAGCSAEDSVRAASKCDIHTSYEIDVVQL